MSAWDRSNFVHRHLKYWPKLGQLASTDFASLTLESATDGHTGRPSPDRALTAFAQLGTLRLQVARCLISLLDGGHQYVLCEATPGLALHDDSGKPNPDPLWLGAVSIPACDGICSHLISESLSRKSCEALVIPDLQQDSRFAAAPHVKGWPHNRFYAGVPLFSEDGVLVGAYCVFDPQPRSALTGSEVDFLQDMARTVVRHLALCELQEVQRSRESMLRGLGAFEQSLQTIEATKLCTPDVPDLVYSSELSSPIEEETAGTLTSKLQSLVTEEPVVDLSSSTLSIKVGEENGNVQYAPSLETSAAYATTFTGTQSPAHVRLFNHAARLICEAADFSGVVFFDAPFTMNDVTDVVPIMTDYHLDCAKTIDESGPSVSAASSDATSRVLADFVAFDERQASGARQIRLHRNSLRAILKQYPRGTVFSCDQREALTKSASQTSQMIRDAVYTCIPTTSAKDTDVSLFPLWNHEHRRWSALALCWSSGARRKFNPAQDDLEFLRIFGDCITNGLARLEALVQDHAKTAFIESLSHELRSPLNGILGGIKFVTGSITADPFEQDMLTSVQECARTLSDTLSHLLDYAKLNHIKQNSSTITNGPLASDLERRETVDLSLITEQVVEAVYSSHSFAFSSMSEQYDMQDSPQQVNGSQSPAQHPALPRKDVRVLLNVAQNLPDDLLMPPGVWNRLVMNLFGNSLKFTHSGLIKISLSCREPTTADSLHQIVLTVSDTGKGISPRFLKSDLFSAFTQEDPFSDGVGLGMNLVQSLVKLLNGSIKVQSQVNQGTEVRVELAIPRAITSDLQATNSPRKQIANVASRLKNKSFYLFDLSCNPQPPNVWSQGTGPRRHATSICTINKDWFGLDVTVAPDWGDIDNAIAICLNPSLQALERTEKHWQSGKKFQVFFICLDAIEAATLQESAQRKGMQDIVQTVIQPCGPLKLCNVFERCLARLDESTPPALQTSRRKSQLSLQRKTTATDPQTQPDMSSSDAADGLPTQEAGKPIVLVVDDNPINIKLMSAFLRRKGIPHKTAVNGRQAVDMYEAVQLGTYTHILMDLSMPVLDGLGATREIRCFESGKGSERRATIVATTGLASAASQADARSAGMDHYMAKPIRFDALFDILDQPPQNGTAQTS